MPIFKVTQISQQHQDQLLKIQARNRRFATEAESANQAFLPSVEVRILIVTDLRLIFSDSPWGLSTFIDKIMLVPPRPYIKIKLTVATIEEFSGVPDPDLLMGKGEAWFNDARKIRSFDFSNKEHFPPGWYHQVWLFGDQASSKSGGKWEPAPSNAQLSALCEFMNGGGGVFAAGDHDSIGSRLCGFVPRVRSMRKWFGANGGPFGEPPGPHMTNPDRNDTNHPSPADPVSGSESDDVPQRIFPTLSARSSAGAMITSPHSLLLGRRGVIDVMPDHPHEGECILPWELDRTEFGVENGKQFTFVEFPFAEDQPERRVLPEIIATSVVAPGKNGNFSDKTDATNAHKFGSICVYDGWRTAGHAAGRIVTDSTWHHFINLNLVGFASADGTGLLASTEGFAHLEQIREYYCNLVLWLMPRPLWEQSILRAIWMCIWENRMLENVTGGDPVKLDSALDSTLLSIGRHSRRVLTDFIGAGQFDDWLCLLLEKFLPAEIIDSIRPWPRVPGLPPRAFQPWISLDSLFDFALAGVIVSVRERFPQAFTASKPVTADSLAEIVDAGARNGLVRGMESLAAAGADLSTVAGAIKNLN